jgi:RNA polymerase sigma factor (sigma-70 family)
VDAAWRHLFESRIASGFCEREVDQAVTPELLGRLLDEQGGALALYAAQWTDQAEDCVQEALIELARQPAVPTSPVAWLYRVVRNRAISLYRARRRRGRHEELATRLMASGAAWQATASDAIAKVELVEALAALPDEQRECLVARTWSGLNFEQIAELMGCSTSTAHRRYEAGLAALRERFLRPCQTK